MSDVQREMDGNKGRQGGLWQNWPDYYQVCIVEGRPQKLFSSNHRTPGHALAEFKAIRYGMSEEERQLYVDHFGPRFDAVKGYAIDRMRASGKNVAIIMDEKNQRKTGVISLEPEDQPDGLARDARLTVGKIRRTEGRVVQLGLTGNARRDIGWIAPPTVKQIESDVKTPASNED